MWVSLEPNYKVHSNLTTVYNCGSSEEGGRINADMVGGFCIMNECNITQNRVKGDMAGYLIELTWNDTYVTCVNVIENNQSSGNFNWQSTYAIFKVKSCNYIRNKSPSDDSYLIYSSGENFMSYCCILKNEIKYIFNVYYGPFTFENSTTDSTNSTKTPVTFKNTNIPFNITCPILKLFPTKEKEEENNLIKIYIKKPFNLPCVLPFLYSSYS